MAQRADVPMCAQPIQPARRRALQRVRKERRDARRRALQRERARRWLLPYVERTHPGYLAGQFHSTVCEALERFSGAVERGESPRLMLFAPPRHGKTAIVSQRFPDWHMARHPGHEVVVASYAQDLADSNSRAARTVARDEEHLAIFPSARPRKVERRYSGDYQRADVDRVQHWATGDGSTYKAVGVGGPLTGHGAHILIIDDPVKDAAEARSPTKRQAVWDWYTQVAYTRVAPGGGVLVMLTRWHEDDLAGRILAKARAEGKLDEWEVLRFPAIAEDSESDWRKEGEPLHPERYPIEALCDIKATLGLAAWAALYQQRPVPAAGGQFRREWFVHRYTTTPEALAVAAAEVVITSDAAKKGSATSDFHSIQVWARHADGRRYLLDRVCERLTFPEYERRLDAVVARWKRWAAYLLLEDTANGTTYMQVKGGSTQGVPIIAFHPSRDTPGTDKSKPARADYTARQAEAGLIIIPEALQAPWVEDWVDCHVGFGPGAMHDDDVDAASQLHMRWTIEERNEAVGFDDIGDALGF